MFSNPQSIINQLAIAPGSVVADLGAGTGAFAIPAASKVGPTGKVYACEVQKDILTRLENELRELHITNVSPIHSNIETHQGTRLRDESIDWVIVANVLFQVEDKKSFIAEIRRILKSDGSVLVIDWTESFGNLGPHENQIMNRSSAESLFTEVGFRVAPAVIDAGAHHYAVVFKK